MDIGRAARGVKSLSRHTLEQVVADCSEGILLADAKDPNLPIVYVNPAYEELCGYSADELVGTSWQLAKRDADGQPELARLKAAIGRSEACQVVLSDLRKDGTSWLSELSVAPLHNARGELKYFLCLRKPATLGEASVDQALGSESIEVTFLARELGRAREKIASLNRVDTATGLLKFGYFLELLRRDLGIARRDQRFVSVLVFEIVDFEAYRRTFGSKAADSCQRMIGAQIMRTLRRAGDLCARYDDSTLVASVIGQQVEQVGHLADKIADNVRRLGLHNPRAKSGRYVTIQSAVASFPPGTTDEPDAVIARAQAELRARGDQSAARATAP
jgi:diguanylate cyclase (GGDEF)-like protein/PAS domain S-box-containing protein